MGARILTPSNSTFSSVPVLSSGGEGVFTESVSDEPIYMKISFILCYLVKSFCSYLIIRLSTEMI